MRVERLAKSAVNVVICLFILLIIYLANLDEVKLRSKPRDDELADYEYYFDGNSLDSLAVDHSPSDLGQDEEDEPVFLRKGVEDRRKMMEELVIVVVATGDDPTDVVEKDPVDTQALEAPTESPPESDDVEVLRDNDIIVENVVIDRSEDLTVDVSCNFSTKL